MAHILHIDFDYTDGLVSKNSAGAAEHIVYPVGVGVYDSNYRLGFTDGVTAGSYALDSFGSSTSSNICTWFSRGLYGNPTKIATSFRLRFKGLATDHVNGYYFLNNQSYPQVYYDTIFCWGNFRVRILSATSLGLYNGYNNTPIATITHPGLRGGVWYTVRIIADFPNGALSCNFDGFSASYTGLNVGAISPWIFYMFPLSGDGRTDCGALDNIDVDDSDLPEETPFIERCALTAEDFVSGWAGADGAATVLAGLSVTSGAGTAQGTGVGSMVRLVHATNPNYAGQTGNVRAVRVKSLGAKKMDGTLATKYGAGIMDPTGENLGVGIIDSGSTKQVGNLNGSESTFSGPAGAPLSTTPCVVDVNINKKADGTDISVAEFDSSTILLKVM